MKELIIETVARGSVVIQFSTLVKGEVVAKESE